MAEEQILVAVGGMDQDTSLHVPPPGTDGISPFSQGSYRYALNCRIGSSVEGNIGSVENIPSTLLIDNYYTWNGSAWVSGSAPAGTNLARGKFEDKDEGAVYWAVYNSNGDHQILKFVKFERKIYELIKYDFNWFATSIVSMSKIDKFLFFCEGDNPPRVINTEEIWVLKSTLGSNFSEYHISFAKWAPLAPPLVRRNVSGQSDQVKRGIFQFSYRYIYKNGFQSTWSPFSWYVTNMITSSDYNFNIEVPGFIFDYDNPDNTAYGHSSIKFYEFVEFIEFGYRTSEIDTWKIFKRHTVDSGANQSFEFRNNGPIASIALGEINKYSDSVPFISRACEGIDNRPIFADNDDELPAHKEFDVEDVTVYSAFTNADFWNGPQDQFTSLSGPQQVELGQILNSKQFTFKEGGFYKLGIVYQHWTGRTGLAQSLDKWLYVIPNDNGGNDGSFIHALGFNIPSSVIPPDWAVAYQIVRTNCLNIGYFVEGVVNTIVYLSKTIPASNPDTVGTPQEVQDIVNAFNNSSAEDKAIHPLAQRLAAYYRAEKIEPVLANASRLYFDIANWTQESKGNSDGTMTRNSNDIFYNFQKGDRIVFSGNDGFDSVYDEEIIDFTGNGIIINKPDGLISFPVLTGNFIKIYRPVEFNTANVQYNEIGEWYPITKPTTEDRDYSKRDFRWTDAASVTVSTVTGHTIYDKMPITNGDCWIVTRQMFYNWATSVFNGISGNLRWVQMNPDKSNAGGRWEHNVGRPYPGYQYFPTVFRKKGQARFGNRFLQNSVFVGINSFDDPNQAIYPSEYGTIRALVNTSNAQVESVGNILLIICEQEALSVYVNRTTLEDLSGRTQVSISDKVLGSYNTLLGSQGTLNPESISRESGRVLWWNARRGVWVRYSRDGLTEISDEGMKGWFKDLSELLINEYSTNTPPRVISTFDDFHQEWINRIDHSSLPSTFKGYAEYKFNSFSERPADKRWKSIYSYAPDLLATMDNEVYSVIGPTIQIHEAGTDYNSFYGVKKDSMLELVANMEVRKNKIWEEVIQDASDKWSFPYLRGDWRSNGTTQQESRLLLDDLQKKEDTYWAAIKNDKNTPNAASPEAGVVSGERMRSKTLRIMQQLDPSVTWLSVWNYLTVGFDFSNPNPKK